MRSYEHIIVGGERMLIGYTSLAERLVEIRLREDAHKAIEEAERVNALVRAALNV